MNQCVITEDQKSSNLYTHPKTSSPLPLSPSPPYGLRLCYWVEEPNCFSFVLRDSILSVGLQPPKPQLAAQSACLEECEGLLMVTPSLTVQGARSHTALTLFFSHTHKHSRKQTSWPTQLCTYCTVCTQRPKPTQAGTESLSLWAADYSHSCSLNNKPPPLKGSQW